MSAELERARARGRALTAETARAELIRLLELEPMGTRADGVATWDDVVAYVAKALGTRAMQGAAIRRRTAELAAVLHAPDGATWPELMAMVQANIGQCTTDVGGTGERCVLGAFHPGGCDA